MILQNDQRKVLRACGGLFLLLLLFVSCSPAQQEKKNENTPAPIAETNIEKGKVAQVNVRSNAGESYSLYVPSSYDKSRKYGVIFFFDAHGAGDLPLNKYKSLADKYDLILAGSNNSKNGLAFETTFPFAQHMMQQVKSDLSIDDRMIFTAGFSGGARVAANVAMMDQSVRGVIGCSAGFQPQNDSLPFVFAGVTADEDMNYLEMQQLELQLNKNKGEHVLIEGKGKHEWPDTVAMKDAMRFMIFRTMKKDSKKEWIEEFKNEKLAWFKSTPVISYRAYQLAYRYLESVDEDEAVKAKNEMKKLEASPLVIQWKKDRVAAFAQEEKMQQAYSQALLSQPLDWWAVATKKLSEGKAETNDVAMSHRVLNYLSLQCYMIVNQAMKQGDAKATSHFLTIYSMVDPSNPEWAYLFAVVNALSGDSEKAVQSLQQAADLGFSDYNRLNSEPAFVPLKNDEKFRAVSDKISSSRK